VCARIKQPSREKATDMLAAPHCITCNLERTLISIQPGRNRHDVRSYECPVCKGIFRLVVERTSFEADELAVAKPARKAAAR
jgi:hypothetical protein